MSHGTLGCRVGVIGSHGAVGQVLAQVLRDAGCEVVCGNRTKRSPDEDSVFVDARQEDSVREFARGCDVVVNCAGPSYVIRDGVAKALPPSLIYIDPFGGNAFGEGAGECPSIINVGCTPGLSGLLAKWLAAEFEECSSVTVCCGGREQGGVSGFADVILSTRDGYGYPNQMLVGGLARPYTEQDWEAQDTDSFPEDGESLRTPFVTDELRRVASECGIPQLTGLLVIPDRDSLHLLLKAMTHSEAADPNELMGLFAQIDSAKSKLDAGKELWFTLQVSARGRRGSVLQRSGITLHAGNSSELTGIVLAQAVLRALEHGCPPGVHWGYEFLELEPVLDALSKAGVQVNRLGPVAVGNSCAEPESVESGFI
ncbi:MAG: NAD-dependent epimerase/dehydratase family protein [Propionibacteriaceae bacterium]|nr:NAD-dependent epimerase/dehydratase family protein [Propionibacteriaceae bacterium]